MSEPVLDEQGRPEPPLVADEEATLLGFLDFLRATIWVKTSGLSDDQLLSRPLKTSMTLGGLLKHLSFVEDFWFGHLLAGRQPALPWADVDWDADPDWDWNSAADDDGDALRTLWQKAVADSGAAWSELRAGDGFSLDSTVGGPGDEKAVRWVLTHMVEEYGRHCGHADLLREAIDGAVGE